MGARGVRGPGKGERGPAGALRSPAEQGTEPRRRGEGRGEQPAIPSAFGRLPPPLATPPVGAGPAGADSDG